MVVTAVGPFNLKFRVDGSLYNLAVLHKCFYWYGAKYSIDITTTTDGYFISIEGIDLTEDKDAFISKIKRDLIDFKTRDIIATETRNIREMLVAKAFANDDTFDEEPPGNVNDPLGFDPSKI